MADELAVRDDTQYALGIIKVGSPHDIIVEASRIATELKAIVATNKLSRKIQGREYVFVEGWSTMGAMLGVLPREMPELFRWEEDGSCEATIELFRITDGMVVGRASARVGADEIDSNGNQTWGSRPAYARKSMCQTRATGKAFRLGFSWIMTMAGYAPTPYEEMQGMSKVIEGTSKPAVSKPKVKGPKPFDQMTANELADSFEKFITKTLPGFDLAKSLNIDDPEVLAVQRDQMCLEVGQIMEREYQDRATDIFNFCMATNYSYFNGWVVNLTDPELYTFWRFLSVTNDGSGNGPQAATDRLKALDTVEQHLISLANNDPSSEPVEEKPF